MAGKYNLYLLSASHSNDFNFICSQATFINLVKQAKTAVVSVNDFTSNPFDQLWGRFLACLRIGLAGIILGQQDEGCAGRGEGHASPDKIDSAAGSIPGSSGLHGVQGLQSQMLTVQITPFPPLLIYIQFPVCSKAGQRKRKEIVMGRTGVRIRKAGHKARRLEPGTSSWAGPTPLRHWVQGRLAEQNSESEA